MTRYEDDKIEYIENDIEKIQRKLGMYISYKGSKGALHLAKEVINNAIDEVINEKSPGKNVEIIFEEKENKIIVIDDGRGIPFDMVELVSTKIQSGSKFDRASNTSQGASAGENGVGLTAVNALSKEMIFNVFRDGKKGTFVFNDGKLIKKEVKAAGKRDREHGTTVSFVPDEKYLEKCQISTKDLSEWINDISYLIDPSVNMFFSLFKKDSNGVAKTIKYKHKNGIVDLLDSFVEKNLFDPIYINFNGSYDTEENGNVRSFIVDTGKNKPLKNKIAIQVAFTINPEVHDDDNSHYKSFCNYVNTIDHGVHVDAAKTAWCQVLRQLTLNALTENELKKYPVSFEDARIGLFFTINLMCENPQFASQTKEKISNDDLFKPIRYIIWNYLNKYFRDNPLVLKKTVNYVKQNARARLEVSKIHKSEYQPIDILSEHTLKCFNPANGNGYREIFIVEGDSAKGSLVNARDARTQALFAVRGVPKNTYGLKLIDVLSNQEFKFLIKCLGCGIGKDFNINKLKYDKIIIFTDSDIDGFRITSLLCTFFLTQYPEIIKAGKLYKAVAPLYIIDDPKHPYILNKIEYYSYFADKIAKIIDLYDRDGNLIKGKEFKELMLRNNRYLDLLSGVVGNHFINPDIAEFITEFKRDDVSDNVFNKMLNRKFPEMYYINGVVKGAYNMSRQYLIMSEEFILHTRALAKAIKANGSNTFSFKDKKANIEMKNITMGKFLQYAKKYMPRT